MIEEIDAALAEWDELRAHVNIQITKGQLEAAEAELEAQVEELELV